MYIRKVEIKNIRSIKAFEMEFPDGKEAGWHVLIGNNGSGKSTILQSIAMGILGYVDVMRIDPKWESWIRQGENEASIFVQYKREDRPDLHEVTRDKNEYNLALNIVRSAKDNKAALNFDAKWTEGMPSHEGKRFSCGFGAVRRFIGKETKERDTDITPLTPFETLFKPEIILTSSLAWIKDLRLRSFENDDRSTKELELIQLIIGAGDLLPNGLVIDKITADGVFFRDASYASLPISELSDGVKSIVALLLEFLRLLTHQYGVDAIYQSMSQKGFIDCAGVVMVDEIDAHLHPTWQTRIGQWFTKYFPNIQFIVTTHSPLICRGCMDESGKVRGSIWRLAAPGSGEESVQLNDDDRDKLIYGNILDAYGTGAFGENVERTKKAQDLLKELARLDKLHTFGQITPEQDQQRLYLQKIFTTDVISDF
jgi:predicted ATPase